MQLAKSDERKNCFSTRLCIQTIHANRGERVVLFQGSMTFEATLK